MSRPYYSPQELAPDFDPDEGDAPGRGPDDDFEAPDEPWDDGYEADRAADAFEKAHGWPIQ